MKKHLIALGTLFLFTAAGLVASAQSNDPVADAAARLAARRAAEGGDSAPAAPAAPVAAPAAAAAPSAPAATNAADAPYDEQADEARRKAAIAAALKDLPANNKPALQIITRNNIFDPQRVPYVGYRATPVIETFSLRGVSEIVGKGLVAFFVGDGVPSYPSTRVIGDKVGDFMITNITLSNVTLVNTKYVAPAKAKATNAASTNVAVVASLKAANNATTGPEIVLALDHGLTRTDAGPWTAYTYTPSYPALVARAPMDNSATMLAQSLAAIPTLTFDPLSGAFSMDTTDPNNVFNQFGRGRGRGTRGGGVGGVGGGRGGRGGGGGFGGGAGGGFGGGGFGGGAGGAGFGGANATFAPAAGTATAAPDPAVLQRLQQQRAAGN